MSTPSADGRPATDLDGRVCVVAGGGNGIGEAAAHALALPSGLALTAFGITIAPGLGLGLVAVYASIVGDIYTRAGINWLRFRSGRWKAVAQAGAARARTSDD